LLTGPIQQQMFIWLQDQFNRLFLVLYECMWLLLLFLFLFFLFLPQNECMLLKKSIFFGKSVGKAAKH